MYNHFLIEAFEYRKKQLGEVPLPKSSITDPFIQKMIKLISKGDTAKEQELINKINERQQKTADNMKLAPILFHSADQNIPENILFTAFCSTDIEVPGAPKFANVIFQKLLRNIEGNHAEMFPMRSFIDDRPLPEKKIDFAHNPPDFENSKKMTTACASPKGVFTFNVPFMQKLMDWSFLKGKKPKRPIYESNGGPFPDEYAPLEFLIMHEYMHYTNDDFYYQHIIPKANNKIINYVGDFRSNYLLVKSGFEALPIGLYNDKVNYDRQTDYIHMYNIIKEEMEKLPKEKRESMEGDMDEMEGDDHEPGTEDAQDEDSTEKVERKKDAAGKKGEDITEKMDEHAKKEAEKVENGSERNEKPSDKKANPHDYEEKESQGPGKGSNSEETETNLRQIKPTFSWQDILRKFMPTDAPRYEEQYSKFRRSAISGMEVARQTGAGYMPPGEVPIEGEDVKIAFVMDTSGSMSGAVPVIMANAIKLLKMPAFNRAIVSMFKFASTHTLKRKK